MATFTSIYHRNTYPAISPKRPELSQAGRSVLITGSSSGVGLSVARNFVLAQASQVIITGRRENVLHGAAEELRALKQPGSLTEIIERIVDITDENSMQGMWANLDESGIMVDVLVLSAAGASNIGVLSHGSSATWKIFESNVLAQLRMVEKFLVQGPELNKILLYVSTIAAHFNPNLRGAVYSTSKGAFTRLLHCLADEIPLEKLRIITFHPGIIFTEAATKDGATQDSFPFDHEDLPGSFCVWAASKEAEFLHGRYVLANWDVEELMNMKKRLQEDPGFLRMGLQGIDPVNPADFFTEIRKHG